MIIRPSTRAESGIIDVGGRPLLGLPRGTGTPVPKLVEMRCYAFLFVFILFWHKNDVKKENGFTPLFSKTLGLSPAFYFFYPPSIAGLTPSVKAISLFSVPTSSHSPTQAFRGMKLLFLLFLQWPPPVAASSASSPSGVLGDPENVPSRGNPLRSR